MPDDSHRVVNLAALSFKEGRFDEALRLYQSARAAEGNTAKLSYNVALCYFRLREYAQALKVLQEVIERGAQEHPELSVGGAQDGVELRSVGNSAVLIKTRLIECFNLKARKTPASLAHAASSHPHFPLRRAARPHTRPLPTPLRIVSLHLRRRESTCSCATRTSQGTPSETCPRARRRRAHNNPICCSPCDPTQRPPPESFAPLKGLRRA